MDQQAVPTESADRRIAQRLFEGAYNRIFGAYAWQALSDEERDDYTNSMIETLNACRAEGINIT